MTPPDARRRDRGRRTDTAGGEHPGNDVAGGDHRVVGRPQLVIRWARGRVSWRSERRAAIVFAGCVMVAVAALALTLAVGQYDVPPVEVLRAIVGRADSADQLVVGTLRLPRALTALLVGACLGMSGAIFQSISQNPLVAPDIIGINNGAALAVVAAVVVGHSGQPPAVFAIAGALAAGGAVYTLSSRSGLSRYRLVLVGIGVNALLGAVITYLLTEATLDQVAQLDQYLLGDVSSATWSTVGQLAPPALVLLLAGTALVPRLQALQLGDDVAASLGVPVARSRAALLAVGVGLAAVAVAAAGPVGFVAFISPHIGRRLARTGSAVTVPIAAVVGAALVVAADYVGQRALEPTQLPVGILTVVLGGPYFLLLLLRTQRSGLTT